MRLRLLLALLLALFATQAQAQTSVFLCIYLAGGIQQCSQVSATNPLPVTTTTSSAAANPIGISPTDHTITSASGSSQTLMNANTTRHSLMVVNTGNANCGVNPLGGTAAIGGAGTITLAPLGSYSPRVPTLTAITVICTAGQPIYADDN